MKALFRLAKITDPDLSGFLPLRADLSAADATDERWEDDQNGHRSSTIVPDEKLIRNHHSIPL